MVSAFAGRLGRPSRQKLAERTRSASDAMRRLDPVDQLIVLLLAAFGAALNHSNVIMGLNLSLADPFAVLLLLTLLISRKLLIPVLPLTLFLLLSVQQICVALFISQEWSSARLPLMGVLSDYVKLLAAFACLLIGVQVLRMGYTWLVLRAFIAGSVAVSMIGLVSLAIPSLTTVGDLFLGDFRFQGLTNDPNNFAIMTTAALAALWYDPDIRPFLRVAASTVLVSGVLLSASKTGAIALSILVLWRVLGMRVVHEDGTATHRLRAPVLLAAASALVLLIVPGTAIGSMLADAVDRTPALARIAPLVTDFDTAVVGSGSARGSAWITALAVIGFSPVVGVGVGTYLEVAVDLTGSPVLAHNTYLQIAAEWGVLLAIVFFAWIARCVTVSPKYLPHFRPWAAGSTALLVLLIGSIGLSLNNSRLFWILLGITAAAQLITRTHDETFSSLHEGSPPKPGRQLSHSP